MDSREVREYTHYVISIFVITSGFLISNCAFLKMYLLFLIVLLLHWITNGNQCCISKMDYGEKAEYSQGILKKVGIHLSETTICILSYIFLSFLIYYTYTKLQTLCGFRFDSLF